MNRKPLSLILLVAATMLTACGPQEKFQSGGWLICIEIRANSDRLLHPKLIQLLLPETSPFPYFSKRLLSIGTNRLADAMS